tara:strand:- start:174 stop:329 length:156 start_codon:yes stop_codon:yes gene_type:complete
MSGLSDKKAAKKIIKQAKKHPDWYTDQDVYYAKMVKKKIKAEEKTQKETND